MLKVHKLWRIFVRDACGIGNFLVKESGQVSTTVMGTRESFRRENCEHGKSGRRRGLLCVGGGIGFARGVASGGLRMCRQELSWSGG